MVANDPKEEGDRRPPRRLVDGILLLDKPAGLSSNRALQRVKGLLRARKAGHTGSLDPLASGMLPICFGRGTRLSAFLLDANKEYVARATLGARTTTGDAEGEIIETLPLPELDSIRVLETLDRFSGRIEQVPPMYSALKHKGRRLYQLARQGVEVPRLPRQVTIFEIELTDLGAGHLDLRVVSSKGTYIRTLVEDICRDLGTVGHVSMLRRCTVGDLPVEEMVTFDELEDLAAVGQSELDSRVLPLDTIVAHMPSVALTGEGVRDITHGRVTVFPGLDLSGQLRLYDQVGRFIGIGEAQAADQIAPVKVFHPANG